ncbi:FAD-dependent monooxygenase [Amycolatopsis sp. NPDC051903]|uniref:FAD-dependent monooxygenase n=1 Tax=Amycolatopsis sp. NPDC051903 TaxID=3363936 RepID=UPI003787902B
MSPDGWHHTAHGSYTAGGWGPGRHTRIHTVEFTPPHDDGPVTQQELQASLRRTTGTDITVTKVHQATRYSDTTRQATTYRKGHVLLAGDAAHVHSPAGGQGLNVGLGDAVNLGWKLALVATGNAPETLLDTYTRERHPIGAWAQRWSMAQTALNQARGPRADSLREVLEDLLDTPDGATHVVTKISGTWQHYGREGDHPLVGRRVPDLPFTDGTILATHFREGRAVLLDTHARTDAAPWHDRLTVVRKTPAAFADQELAAFIRPDGYVAWACVGEIDDADLRAALTTWLGHPRTTTSGT